MSDKLTMSADEVEIKWAPGNEPPKPPPPGDKPPAEEAQTDEMKKGAVGRLMERFRRR